MWPCLLLLTMGCADFRRGPTWDDIEAGDDDDGLGSTDTDTPSFGGDVYPLLVAGCQSCHEPGGAFDYVVGDADETYEATVRIVDLLEPANSRLLVKTRGDGHGGGTIYDRTSDEYAAILSWIEQGALP